MAKGSTVSFHDIDYVVQVGDPNVKCCGPKTDKKILQNIK